MAETSLPRVELDLARYELRRQGRVIRLERQPMELLILLVEKQGLLVTREEIVSRLWPKDTFLDTETSINSAIRKIRVALHDDSENPRYLQTVVGKGYRFIAPIEVIGAPVAIALSESPAVVSPTPPVPALGPKTPRPARLAAVVVAVLLLLSSLGWFGIQPWRHSRLKRDTLSMPPLARVGPGAWLVAPALPMELVYPAVASTQDGRIWVFGGLTEDGTARAEVWVLSPKDNAWSAAPPMPTARGAAKAVALGDRIYVIGGSPTQLGQFNLVEIFDAATGKWSPGPPMPTARFNMAAAVDRQGRIYVLGGITDDASVAMTDRLEILDTKSQRWTTATPMPLPRALFGAAIGSRGELYAIGGDDQNFNILGRVDVYDPATNRWAATEPLPHAVENLSAVSSSNGRIYAIGGLDSFLTSHKTGEMQMLDELRGKWLLLASMPTPRCSIGAVIAPDGRIYAMGGYGQKVPPHGPPALNVVEVFDPTKGPSQ